MTMKFLSRRGPAENSRDGGAPHREPPSPQPAAPAAAPPSAPPSHKRKHSDVLDLDLVAAAAAPSPRAVAVDAGDDDGGERWARRPCAPCWLATRLAALALLLVAAVALPLLRSGGGDDDGTDGAGDPAAVAPKIIGGKASTNAEFNTEQSYVVSLQDRLGRHFCGGTLVSKDAVLTAGHCSNKATGLEGVRAVVGRRRLTDAARGEEIAVRREKVHPSYDLPASGTQRADFALLFLERPTVTKAKVVELNRDEDLPRAGALVGVLGWGDTDPDEAFQTPAETLQVANLRLVSNAQCNDSEGLYEDSYGTYPLSYKGHIEDNMMCASHRRRDSCQGDSGGPLTYRGKQVGITSWGVGCNNVDFPGVYARVSSAYDWIKRSVCMMSMYPDAQFKCKGW